MNATVLDIAQCKVGYILAEDIVNKYGAVIVTSYTTLNSYIIDKLTNLGIKCIKVFGHESIQHAQSHKFKKSYENKALAAKEILTEMTMTGKLDIKKINKLSESIFSQITDNDCLVKFLNNIRNADEYTYYHCLNVSFYAALLGMWLKLSDEKISNLIISGLLHDIGKTRISPEILNKKGELLPEEYNDIKMHTIYGFDIIKKSDCIGPHVKAAVLMHHEREDGSGYPFGYSGTQISTYAKIISVADVYDAMTSERVYRAKNTPFEVFKMFLANGYSSFDTRIINTFLKNIAPLYIGSEVELNTGEKGKVVYIPPHSITAPIIKIGANYIDISKEEEYKIVSCSF